MDAGLLKRLKEREKGAFDEVYAEYSQPLYDFTRRLCGRDVGADVFQDTWLQLVRSAPTLRDDSNLRAWLFVVARNVWRKHRRFVIFDAERMRGLRWSLERDGSGSPDAEMPAASDEQLEQALQRLSVPDREIVLLANESQVGQAELAAMLGIADTAFRQRLTRARQRLAKAVTELVMTDAGGRP